MRRSSEKPLCCDGDATQNELPWRAEGQPVNQLALKDGD